MWKWTTVLLLGCSACAIEQPESARTVAAFNVPLPTASERRELISILQTEAQAEGLHVDGATDRELSETALPGATLTINATIWRGDDDEALVSVMDVEQPGQAVITFAKGEDPQSATRLRERTMRAISGRWPDTASLPVLRGGIVPLRSDLRRTSGGWRLAPEAAPRCAVPLDSPLVVQPEAAHPRPPRP